MIVDGNIGTHDKKAWYKIISIMSFELFITKMSSMCLQSTPQVSRLLEHAIECGQHIQANKNGQQTL